MGDRGSGFEGSRVRTSVVRFKLKSERDFTEVPIDDDSDAISAGQLKEIITQKLGGSAGPFSLRMSNVQTGEGEHFFHYSTYYVLPT